MPEEHPRVPLPVDSSLFHLERSLPVNHCRQPACENFVVPARHRHGKTGRSPDAPPRGLLPGDRMSLDTWLTGFIFLAATFLGGSPGHPYLLPEKGQTRKYPL